MVNREEAVVYCQNLQVRREVHFWPRLCENVLEHVRQSEPERKSLSYVNFRSAFLTKRCQILRRDTARKMVHVFHTASVKAAYLG